MIEKMIVDLIKTKLFYAHFLQQMNRFETEKIETMGVSVTDRINLYYNPKFLETLSSKEKVACLEHEVLHLLCLHLFRGTDKDKLVFNIACDLAINPYIDHLPKSALMPKSFGFEEDKTAEWYYDQLVREKTALQKQLIKAKWSLLDEHGLWDESTGDRAFKEELVKRSIKLSLDETQDYGSIPGKIRETVEEFLETSKINWRSVLERFLIHATALKIRISRKRPNRRFEDLPGEKVEQKLKLLVGLDTSGSIQDALLGLFFSEIEKIKALGMQITVAECDSELGNVYPYRRRPKQVSGGGGTDFKPVFEYAQKSRPDCVVYLTDGYGSYPERSKIPTLWCLAPGGGFSGNFGRVLKLPEIKQN